MSKRSDAMLLCAASAVCLLFSSAASLAAEAPAQLSLGAIAGALADVDTEQREIRHRLADDGHHESLDAEIESAMRALAQATQQKANAPADLMQYFDTADLTIAVRKAESGLASVVATVAARTKRLDEDLDRVAADSAKSVAWLATAKQRQAPGDLVIAIEAVPKRGVELADEVRATRDRLLKVLDQAQTLRRTATIAYAELADRRVALEAQLRSASGTPLWRAGVAASDIDRSLHSTGSHLLRVVEHVRQHAWNLIVIFVVASGLCYALIVATRRRLVIDEAADAYGRRAKRLFDAPFAASLLVALLALLRYGPVGPVAYYDVLVSLLPIPAALLARAMFGERFALTLFTLAAVLVTIAWLGPVVDGLPLVSGLLIIAQCTAMAIVLARDLQRGNLANAFPASAPAIVNAVASGMTVLLVIAMGLTFFGQSGLGRILRNAALFALGLALVLSVAMHLLYGLVVALTHTRVARGLRIVHEHPQVVLRFARRTFIAVATGVWLVAMAQVLGLLDDAVRMVERALTGEIRIGEAHIEFTSIFIGLAVLAGTYLLVKIVRLVVEVELLPRLHLKHGIGFAVSAVVRYAILTGGVLLAMASMGIDLTKVTLLAGALGVGIGLGLQGVVNNFVSGLILLVERPVSAGDYVQLGDVQGVVVSIGVRSTTIRTAQGAEIIVPNAEFISKAVTNWTLTDRRRKLEIDVSIPRGVDPEVTMRALEQTTAAVDGVAADPVPRAWLTGVHDSALDFRLHAWVGDIDRALAVQSALRMALARQFKDAATQGA